MHDDVLHRGTIGQRFIYRRLQRHLLAATQAGIAGEHYRGLQVLNASFQSFRGESTEYNRVDNAQPRAGKHRDRQLRNHGHVNRDSVASL